MIIQRTRYLDRLAKLEGNGLVKIVTGIRRCGKSFLLFTLFRDVLRRKGVDDAHVVAVQLDDDDAAPLRTPRALSAWIKARLPSDGRPTYVLVDEIQMCKPPEDEKDKPGRVTFHEVEGSYRLGSQGRAFTAFHEAAAYYPMWRFVWAKWTGRAWERKTVE